MDKFINFLLFIWPARYVGMKRIERFKLAYSDLKQEAENKRSEKNNPKP